MTLERQAKLVGCGVGLLQVGRALTFSAALSALGVADTPAVIWFRKEGRAAPSPSGGPRHDVSWDRRPHGHSLRQRKDGIGGSAWVENPRVYRFAEGVLKPGKNVFVDSCFEDWAQGRLSRASLKICIVLLRDKTSVSLAGEWKGKAERRRPSSASLTDFLRKLARYAVGAVRRNVGAHRSTLHHRRDLVSG